MHYDLVVIVKKGTKNVPERVDKVLEPYDISVDVPPYSKICDCLSLHALVEGHERAEEEIGMTYSALLNEYESQPESDRPSWDEYSRDYQLALTVHATRIIESGHADQSCHLCRGTGIFIGTVNPDGMWDWYDQEGLFQDLDVDTVGKWMELLKSSNKYLLPRYLISTDEHLYSKTNLVDASWESPFPKSIYRWRKIVLDVLEKHNPDDMVVGLNMHV